MDRILNLYALSTTVITYVAAESEAKARKIVKEEWNDVFGCGINWNDYDVEKCELVTKENMNTFPNFDGGAYYDEEEFGPNRTFPVEKVVGGLRVNNKDIMKRILELQSELAALQEIVDYG